MNGVPAALCYVTMQHRRPRRLVQRAQTIALACAMLALAAPFASVPRASAQTPSASIVVNQVDASQYPEMRAVVTALTSAGVPASGLTPASFSVADSDATVAAVSSAQDASLRLGVVLLVDTSGSMEGAPIDAARAAASQLIAQLGPNDEASIMAFSDNVRTVVPFTSDRAALDAGVSGLTAAGPTALYEAVQAAAFAARSSGLPRQAVVLLSDGKNEDSTSPATAADSVDAVRGARVPMFTVGYGSDADVAYLQQIATESRGASYLANQFDVAATYAGIGDLLRSQYVLTLRATAPADGQDAALRIAATIDGQVVTSDPARFVRGAAPVQPTVAPTAPAVAATPAAAADGGGSSNTAIVIIAIAIVVGLVLLLVLSRLLRRVLRVRAQRERDRHAGQVSDETLPAQEVAESGEAAPEPLTQLLLMNGDGSAREFRIGGTPMAIGTDERADIRLDDDGRVARRQATVWRGGGHLRLRHTGGTRPTLVDGRPIDVIILEPGDEFTVGDYRFRVGGEVAPE